MEVDFSNFGQVIACCGMLEIASHINTDSTGHFIHSSTDIGEFILAIPGKRDTMSSVQEVFDKIKTIKPVQVKFEDSHNPFPPNHPISAYLRERPPLKARDDSKSKTRPQDKLAPIGFMDGNTHSPYLLDWWLNERMQPSNLVMWGGQIGAGQIYVSAFESLKIPTFDLIDFDKTFFFDCRSGLDALALGFSEDKSKIKKKNSPFLELMAAWGCQRFRPIIDESFSFAPWVKPLKVIDASIAFSGLLDGLGLYGFKYEAKIVPKGGDYYFRVGRAMPVA